MNRRGDAARRGATRGVNALRRRVVGLAARVSRGGDPGALLGLLPDESLLPLRRTGPDPAPELVALAERCPVDRLKLPLGLRGWLITGHAEARAVLAAGPDTASTDFANLVGRGLAPENDPGGLGFADPPEHTRLRKLVAAHFTERGLARRAEAVTRVVDDALADVARRGRDGAVVDLHRHFAVPVPAHVVAEILGLDDRDRAPFDRLVAARFETVHGMDTSLDAATEAVRLLREIVARQRRAPGPGLIGEVVREHGDSVGDDELAGLFDGILTGGIETTTSTIGLGLVALLGDPAAARAVAGGGEPLARFVEEILRHSSVVQVAFPRFLTRDLELGGRQLLKGDVVVCSLAAANRDARVGDDLGRVVADRTPYPHVAFGHGAHRCLGAGLAKLELRTVYPAVLRRFPDLALAVPAQELPYRELSIVHGLTALPVHLGPDLGADPASDPGAAADREATAG